VSPSVRAEFPPGTGPRSSSTQWNQKGADFAESQEDPGAVMQLRNFISSLLDRK
jgi:hypothetical protein